MGFSISMENWDSKAHYEFGIGCGYYFSGLRTVMRKGEMAEIPIAPEKQTAVFKETLAQFSDLAQAEGGLPFLIIDDCSPVSLPIEELKEIVGDNPLLFIRPPRNLGTAGKENLIQRVLSERCKYVVRFDADVKFDPFTLDYFRDAFAELPDAWAITPCITYFARLDASNLPEDQRYFSGSNIADLAVMDSAIFDEIGYADPKVKWNEDGEYRLRAKAITGKLCYVDKEMTGTAKPTGGGGKPLEFRAKAGRYIDKTRPFIKVVYPKGKTPRLMLDKKRLDEVKEFYIPAHPIAERLANRVWD